MIFFYLLLIPAAALLFVAVWNALAWPEVAAEGSVAPEVAEGAAARVSILIPARNEETNLPACLDAALAQGEIVRELLVYDDHSTDATSEIIEQYAQRDARVRSVPAETLPAGWCGKTFACAQLAASARGDWLLFLDADARLGAGAASRMLAEAERRRLTLLSCWPALELSSFWERALMPLLNFVVFTLYPAPLALRRADASLGLAHGACLLAHRSTYALVGGHGAVRDQLFEDVRLAQLWRARGQASLCLDGQGIVSVRMYRSFAEIWRGFQKNFFPAFRRETSFWLFMSLHLTLFLLPSILAPFVLTRGAVFGGDAATLILLLLFCVLAMRAALALRFKHPWWSVLLHPCGEAILLALGLSSWWRCKSGRGVVWKGRRYRAGAEV
ncbi:MAG TPA: glycosyltransferase [Pyrinomonadaceae bacterium]|jgi:glycosyltransferase involved in cell wall biosynthesis